MQNRKVLIPLALAGSFGIALAPTFAAAASTASHAAASSVLSAKSAGTKKFSSPISKSVFSRHGVSAHTSTNPDLAVGVVAMDSSAYGIELVVGISGLDTGSATLTIDWGDAQTQTATVTAGTDSLVLDHEFPYAGTFNVSATLADGSGDTATNSVDVQTLGSDYTPYGPFRILDTRSGTGAAKAAVAAHGTLKFKVTGKGASGATIPAGITAVVLNVTATQTSTSGVLTAYNDEDPYGDPVDRPGTSNLNWGKGQTVANLVVVPVGANGVVDFYNNSSSSTQVIADVEGYYSATDQSTYHTVTPTRILDTRKGTGTGTIAKVAAGGNVTLKVWGASGVSATASAVQLDVIAVGGTRSGFITAYGGSGTYSATSNVNYGAGQTVANSVIVPVGNVSPGLGEITLHNSSTGTVDLIADLSGYYDGGSSGGSAYIPLDAPERIYDSRVKNDLYTGPIPVAKPVVLPIAEDTTETAFALNATVTDTTGNGYLALYPYNPDKPTAQPTTSTLNYMQGQTIPNLAVVTPGSVFDSTWNAYDAGIYLGGKGTAQVVLDAFGFFADE